VKGLWELLNAACLLCHLVVDRSICNLFATATKQKQQQHPNCARAIDGRAHHPAASAAACPCSPPSRRLPSSCVLRLRRQQP
jgi:hypothetical protein